MIPKLEQRRAGTIAAAGGFLAGFAAGLIAAAVVRNRRSPATDPDAVHREVMLRKQAERQFQSLIESSPAAILVLDGSGRILAANSAAERLLGVTARDLAGQSIAPLIPMLSRVAVERTPVRGVMEARGKRRNGEPFAASVWFSIYNTPEGARMAAILADATEEVREDHEEQLRQVLSGGALLVGAFAHEIRNLSAALQISHSRLGDRAGLQADADYQAMAALLESLSHLAATELRQSSVMEIPEARLTEVFSDLRMIVAPWLEERGVTAIWPAADMPVVQADPRALVQVFINLIQNSLRAMERLPPGYIHISVETDGPRALLVLEDSGPGVADASLLFRPFQPGAEATGLGLYVSRALVRGFAGDLRYEPRGPGSRFVMELQIATGDYGKSDGHSSYSAAG